MIHGKGLAVSLGTTQIISQQTITCESGQVTGLVGPSGAGKTTLLHALGLLLPVSDGTLTIAGRNVTRATDWDRRKFWRDHAAFVLQDYGLIDDETLAFNVTFTHRKGRKVRSDARLHEALEHTGLAGRAEEITSHLSGGEKQRLALARATYKQATYLFVDEPTASLDSKNRALVIDMFTAFAATGATVVVSTHDEDFMNACHAVHDLSMAAMPH
ncbi:ATP-binding cassette domain-containing protein [Micrococcales bacterium 31B]|nr:ATP-binding cassette domain-containing protein [Micrococcales bacterium 31B]